MIPDDTAGRPLTPTEQAAIADLERRFLLDAAAPGRDHVIVARPTRFGGVRRRAGERSAAAVPLAALSVTTLALLAAVVVVGAGLLGAAAVVLSALATALVWPLLPARFGGPLRPRRRFVARGPLRRRS